MLILHLVEILAKLEFTEVSYLNYLTLRYLMPYVSLPEESDDCCFINSRASFKGEICKNYICSTQALGNIALVLSVQYTIKQFNNHTYFVFHAMQ